jgi:hypothetical protein
VNFVNIQQAICGLVDKVDKGGERKERRRRPNVIR